MRFYDEPAVATKTEEEAAIEAAEKIRREATAPDGFEFTYDPTGRQVLKAKEQPKAKESEQPLAESIDRALVGIQSFSTNLVERLEALDETTPKLNLVDPSEWKKVEETSSKARRDLQDALRSGKPSDPIPESILEEYSSALESNKLFLGNLISKIEDTKNEGVIDLLDDDQASEVIKSANSASEQINRAKKTQATPQKDSPLNLPDSLPEVQLSLPATKDPISKFLNEIQTFSTDLVRSVKALNDNSPGDKKIFDETKWNEISKTTQEASQINLDTMDKTKPEFLIALTKCTNALEKQIEFLDSFSSKIAENREANKLLGAEKLIQTIDKASQLVDAANTVLNQIDDLKKQFAKVAPKEDKTKTKTPKSAGAANAQPAPKASPETNAQPTAQAPAKAPTAAGDRESSVKTQNAIDMPPVQIPRAALRRDTHSDTPPPKAPPPVEPPKTDFQKALEQFPAPISEEEPAVNKPRNIGERRDIKPDDEIYKFENTHVNVKYTKTTTYPEGEITVGFNDKNEQVLLLCNNLYSKITDMDELKKLGIADDKGIDKRTGKPAEFGWYIKELANEKHGERWRKMPHENYILNEKTGAFISQKEHDHVMYFGQKPRMDFKKNALGGTVRVSIDQRPGVQDAVEKIAWKEDENKVSVITDVSFEKDAKQNFVLQTNNDGTQSRKIAGFSIKGFDHEPNGAWKELSTIKYVGNNENGFNPVNPQDGDGTQPWTNVKFYANGNISYETKDDRDIGAMTIYRGDGTKLRTKSDRPDAKDNTNGLRQYKFDSLGRIVTTMEGDLRRDFEYAGRSLDLVQVTEYRNTKDANYPKDMLGQPLTFVYKRQNDDKESWNLTAFGEKEIEEEGKKVTRRVPYSGNWEQPKKGQRILSLLGEYSSPETIVSE